MNNTFYMDFKRCSGCYACMVACMDQNDIDVKETSLLFRKVYCHEQGNFPDEQAVFVTFACMHCEDTPCLFGCPTAAITVDSEVGAVYVNAALCIGCHSCAMSCPFGIPRFDNEGTMKKCHSCRTRVKNNLEPACVRACPTLALQYGPLNQIGEQKAGIASKKLLTTL